jgi:cell division protein FtsL
MPAVFVIALLAIGLISMLYLSQASAVATAGYDIKRLEDQKAQWQIKNAQLSMRIAQLRSLERIDTEARSRLKMGPPTKVLYLPVDLQAVGR